MMIKSYLKMFLLFQKKKKKKDWAETVIVQLPQAEKKYKSKPKKSSGKTAEIAEEFFFFT